MANKVEPRFDPLTGELLPESTAPKQAQPAASADNPLMGLSGAEMEKLDKMPVEQLRTLVRTICGAMNGLPRGSTGRRGNLKLAWTFRGRLVYWTSFLQWVQ